MIIRDFNINFLLEIILEGLPISSSGHLELLSLFYSNIKPISFLYAHLAHVFIFFIQLFYIFPFFKSLLYKKKYLIILKILFNFFSITTITVIGYLIKKIIIENIFPFYKFPLCCGFLITTIFLLSIYYVNKTRSRNFSTLIFKESIFLGIWQCLAFLPGVSRLATMILGAEICKFTRKDALFIGVMSNVAISMMSIFYILYYNFFIENIIIIFSFDLLFKLLLSLLLSALLFYFFIFLFNRNKIFLFFLYEFFIFLFSYYIY